MSGKGRPSLDVYGNPVFLQTITLIAKGVNTPVEISGRLGLKQTTLVKYLNILRRNGFVRYGEKSGKNQPYVVNWDRLAEAFIDTVLGGRLWVKALKEAELIPVGERPHAEAFPPLEKVEELMGLSVKELASKASVIDIVRAGLEELGKSPELVKNLKIGLKEYFASFADMLAKVRGLYDLNVDEELRRLFEDISTRLRHPGSFDWFNAMKKRGIIREVKA